MYPGARKGSVLKAMLAHMLKHACKCVAYLTRYLTHCDDDHDLKVAILFRGCG